MKNRAIIKVHYKCNNNCDFCHCQDNKDYAINYDVSKKIEEAKNLGVNEILLSGGEPTINKEIFKIIKEIKSNELEFGLITNARMLSNEKFFNKIIFYEPKYFYISLHSKYEHIHDEMSGINGAWRQTLKGIKNIISRKLSNKLIVNCVVTSDNVEVLNEQAKMLMNIGVEKIKFSYPEMKGTLKKNPKKMPDAEIVSKNISEALDIIEENNKIGLYDGLPYCCLPNRHRMKLDNLETNNIFYMSECFEDNFFRTDEGLREKNSKCLECSFHNICQGYNSFSNINNKAIIETIPEKIIFKPNINKEKTIKNPCTIKIKERNNFTKFEHKKEFFKSYNIEEIKNKESIFLFKPDNNNNFLQNLKLIKKNKESVFEISETSFYDLVKNEIKTEINNLKGKMLDIGVGDLNFGKIFENLQNNDIIDYIGIDPNKNTIISAKKRYNNLNFMNYSIEELSQNNKYTEYFDSIIMIGCYNHFEDLNRAFKSAKKMLKKNGKIIIYENNLMGIIDQYNIFKQNELEHYRNHSQQEAINFLKNQNFNIVKNKEFGAFWKIKIINK